MMECCGKHTTTQRKCDTHWIVVTNQDDVRYITTMYWQSVNNFKSNDMTDFKSPEFKCFCTIHDKFYGYSTSPDHTICRSVGTRYFQINISNIIHVKMIFATEAFMCVIEFSFVDTRTCGMLLQVYEHWLHPLQWRNNESRGVPHHQGLDGWLKYLFQLTSTKKHRSPRYRSFVRGIHRWISGCQLDEPQSFSGNRQRNTFVKLLNCCVYEMYNIVFFWK